MNSPIQVWRFDDAPEEYKKLSPHGGDEDWLALVPENLIDQCIDWMDPNSGNSQGFGCCDISRHKLKNGDEVRIGAHA